MINGFIANYFGIMLIFVALLLCACGQLSNTPITDPAASPPTQGITPTAQIERSPTPNITTTAAKTPAMSISPAIFATPQSINDIPIPPQASKVGTFDNNHTNFFVPTTVYKDYAAVLTFYSTELPLLGWKHCQTASCANKIVTATDTAYDSYKFDSPMDNGPYLQIIACPEHIVYCEEIKIKEGGFNVSIRFFN